MVQCLRVAAAMETERRGIQTARAGGCPPRRISHSAIAFAQDRADPSTSPRRVPPPQEPGHLAACDDSPEQTCSLSKLVARGTGPLSPAQKARKPDRP